jgi:hypothetical protein
MTFGRGYGVLGNSSSCTAIAAAQVCTGVIMWHRMALVGCTSSRSSSSSAMKQAWPSSAAGGGLQVNNHS